MSPQTFCNYIGGEWVDGPVFENRNPAATGSNYDIPGTD